MHYQITKETNGIIRWYLCKKVSINHFERPKQALIQIPLEGKMSSDNQKAQSQKFLHVLLSEKSKRLADGNEMLL